jgi:hypothetical protein
LLNLEIPVNDAAEMNHDFDDPTNRFESKNFIKPANGSRDLIA